MSARETDRLVDVDIEALEDLIASMPRDRRFGAS